MLNFIQFVLLLVAILLLMIILFFLTGIVYNQKGEVSIIEKKKKFYKLENHRFAYYLPIMYRKVCSYPYKNERHYRINGKSVFVKVNKPMYLYEHHIDLKQILKEKRFEEIAKKYFLIIRLD